VRRPAAGRARSHGGGGGAGSVDAVALLVSPNSSIEREVAALGAVNEAKATAT
jgi:hypothetical protein